MTSIYQIGLAGLAKLAFLSVTVLLYKLLPQAEMGNFALLYAIGFVLSTIFEVGLRGFLVREIARNTANRFIVEDLLAGALKSRIVTLIPYLGLGAVSVLVIAPAAKWAYAIPILLGTWLDSNAGIFHGAIRAFGRTITDVALTFVSRLILLITTSLLYYTGQLSLVSFAILFVSVTLLDLAVTLVTVRHLGSIRLIARATTWNFWSLTRQSRNFVLIAVLSTIYFRVGTIVLGSRTNVSALQDTAGFNLAGRIPEGVSFLSVALMNAAIPYLSQNHNRLPAIIPVLKKLERVLGSAALIITIGLYAHAESLIMLMATPQYLQYKHEFQLYGLSVFLTFLQYVYMNLLISINQEKAVVLRHAVVLVVSVVLNLLLIPRYGVGAAVIILLLCEGFAVICDARILRRNNIMPFLHVYRSWIAIGMLCVLAASLSLLLSPLLGCMAYWLFGLAVGCFLLYRHRLEEPVTVRHLS